MAAYSRGAIVGVLVPALCLSRRVFWVELCTFEREVEALTFSTCDVIWKYLQVESRYEVCPDEDIQD